MLNRRQIENRYEEELSQYLVKAQEMIDRE